MMLTGIDKPKIYSEEIMENLEDLTSILEPGDWMICKLQDKDWGALHDFVEWLNQDPRCITPETYCHAMFYFGCTEAKKPLFIKEPLIIEERKPRGAKITTLYRHIGRPVEVYRIEHQYQKEFARAIIKIGEIIADGENSFFDYFVIPRMLWERLGVDIKYRPKLTKNMHNCSELLRTCLERPKEVLDKDLIEIYEKDILAKIVIPHYRIFWPRHLVGLEFGKKVWEGRIGYPIKSEICKENKNISPKTAKNREQ